MDTHTPHHHVHHDAHIHHYHHHTKQQRHPERPYIHAMNTISTIGWSITAIAIYYFFKAAPAHHFDRKFEQMADRTWGVISLRYMFYAFIAALIFSIIGLIINAVGHHHDRKKLFYRVNLVMMGIISICGIFLYLMR